MTAARVAFVLALLVPAIAHAGGVKTPSRAVRAAVAKAGFHDPDVIAHQGLWLVVAQGDDGAHGLLVDARRRRVIDLGALDLHDATLSVSTFLAHHDLSDVVIHWPQGDDWYETHEIVRATSFTLACHFSGASYRVLGPAAHAIRDQVKATVAKTGARPLAWTVTLADDEHLHMDPGVHVSTYTLDASGTCTEAP